MTQKFSRAQRRSDYARLKRKRQFHYGYGYKDEWNGMSPKAGDINFMPEDVAGKVTRTPCNCSCWMCGNPRRGAADWGLGKLTKQEVVALDKFADSFNEWYPFLYLALVLLGPLHR